MNPWFLLSFFLVCVAGGKKCFLEGFDHKSTCHIYHYDEKCLSDYPNACVLRTTYYNEDNCPVVKCPNVTIDYCNVNFV